MTLPETYFGADLKRRTPKEHVAYLLECARLWRGQAVYDSWPPSRAIQKAKNEKQAASVERHAREIAQAHGFSIEEVQK